VEVVCGAGGLSDVHHARGSLTARGMHRIICRMARFEGNGRIEFEPRDRRLCG